MNILSRVADFARSPGDPRLIRSGPDMRPASDRVARALGWFSIALGAMELAAPQAITRPLGMEGKEGLLRAFGVREIAAGMTSLSTEKTAGLWSRVAGDVMDIATLLTALRDDNPRKPNVALALTAVAVITLIDVASAKAAAAAHARGSGDRRDYSGRSGFPQGLQAARGSARASPPPADHRGSPAG